MSREAKSRAGAGHRERLRQRFATASLDGFHDYEIVELLLTFAIPRRDVKPIAKALVRRFRGIKGLCEATEKELVEVEGIGENAAVLLMYVKEMARAYLEERASKRCVISSPEDAAGFFLSGSGPATGAAEPVESFCAVYLNTRNEVLGMETIHRGPLSRASVHPRQILEKAFAHNARSVIFIHHRPTGRASLTLTGRRLRERLEDAARAIDILVHDHIIIGRDAHTSAREMGLLKG